MTRTKLSIGYTADIKDNGITLVHDCDWILDVEVTLSGGAPEIEVVGVYADNDSGRGVNLMTSPSSKTTLVACDIASEAEADEWFIEKVLDDAGVTYCGLGGNDPDGHYVFRREREEA